MKIAAIVAVSENGLIGKNGQLPWEKIPEDLKRFKELTTGHAVIMGRITWESLPVKPLPGRDNIVIMSHSIYPHPNGGVFRSIDSAITRAKCRKYDQVFLIGGEQIYREGLQYCDEVYLTQVHGVVEYKQKDIVSRFEAEWLCDFSIDYSLGHTQDGRASFYKYSRIR